MNHGDHKIFISWVSMRRELQLIIIPTDTEVKMLQCGNLWNNLFQVIIHVLKVLNNIFLKIKTVCPR